MAVVQCDVFLDGCDQIGNTVEDAALKTICRDAAKEALDHVEPGRGGRREMHVETRMLFQPSLHFRMLVRGVVVAAECVNALRQLRV